MNLPILSVITFLPLVAALVIVFFVPKKNEKAIIHIATWTALADFFAAFDRWVVVGAVNGTARTTLALSYVKATVDRWGVDLAVNGVGWGRPAAARWWWS